MAATPPADDEEDDLLGDLLQPPKPDPVDAADVIGAMLEEAERPVETYAQGGVRPFLR